LQRLLTRVKDVSDASVAGVICELVIFATLMILSFMESGMIGQYSPDNAVVSNN
jgi:hypothetical protein